MSSSDLKALKRAIILWNESRLDLFEISKPDKNNEFHGVIRFYHLDSSNHGKYATKCVRVSNTATTTDVIETLSEKFRSDMRMLSKPNYVLYEVHNNGESRKLKNHEHPLTVQLRWIKDDREGRFLLHNEDDKRPVHVGNGLYEESEETVKGEKVSTKKDKKQKKKKGYQKPYEDFTPAITALSQEQSAAKQLYNEVPESTFTRTVSNPEAVMKKRREQKLQKRGAELLKIYGDNINKEIPYKTLMLLPSDNTDTVIRDALDKYGLGREKTSDYMIVKVVLPPGSKPEELMEGGWGKETILGPDECPLDIEQKWQHYQGTLVFQLRPSTSSRSSKRKQKTSSSSLPKTEEKMQINSNQHEYPSSKENHSRLKERQSSATDMKKKAAADYENVPRQSKEPKLLELFGSEKVVSHIIAPNVTEIGCDRRSATYGPFIELRKTSGLLNSHCVITNMDGVVTVTPQDNEGEVFVDGRIIQETTMLVHGNVVWLGRGKHLVFCDPDKDITISSIRHKIKATAPREQQRRNNSVPNTARQKDGSTPNPLVNRARYPSSTSSSRSGSALPGRNTVQEQKHLQEAKSRVLQSHLPPATSPTEKALHQRSAPPQTATVQPIQQSTGHRLPATLKVVQNLEESLISEILSVHTNRLHFKLSPAYTIYLILRHFVDFNPKKIMPSLLLVTDLLEQTIQMKNGSIGDLTFWMSNASELLNFIRQDKDLAPHTAEIQVDFAKTVQLSFRYLVQSMQRTLFELMPAFLSESIEDLPGGSDDLDLKKHNRNTDGLTMYDILQMLSSVMSLLRRCRVNAALTIQLFSQLFHSVNMWLFNKLVASSDSRRLCCREWGMRIRARLAMVETWAERQGLELAADCHLARITQATHLLQAPKYTSDDIAAISGTCFKLNSLQLGVLLSNYQPDERGGEKRISQNLIDEVVAVAEDSADELTRSDGRDIQLEEDPDLQLPFLLPEDGYSCDTVSGVPSGLIEFLQPLQQDGLCTFNIEPNSPGNWTIHFQSILQQYQNALRSSRDSESANQHPAKPEIISITFNKQGGGMGLSIVAAKGIGQDKQGIYIRSVVKGGASDLDGRLQAGDQLLSVNGQSLIGVDQARAAELMTRSGQTVTLNVAKQGAVYHGLAKMLSQPSPKTQHAHRRFNHQHDQARPKSEGYALYPNQSRNHSGGQSAHSQLFGGQGRPFASQKNHISTLNHSTPHLISPQPMYSPHYIKPLKVGDSSSFVGNPAVTVPIPLLQNKSSSVHSVASLDESSSTTDSGFNSVAAAQPLVPSPNSAFSPRPSFAMQKSLNDTLPRSTDSVSSDWMSIEPTSYGDLSFINSRPFDTDRSSIYSEPVARRHPKESDVDSDAESAIYTRGRQRYRRAANRFLESETSAKDDRSRSRNRYATQAELRRLSTRKTLFDQFLAQAEERDQQARRDKEVFENLTRSKNERNRTRSASLNRTSGNAGNAISFTGSNLKRSNSTNTRNQPFSTGALRRSNSVDIQERIKKAEQRDRHARVEQARLEGLVPPRGCLGRKDSIKMRSTKPASSIIQEFECKNKDQSVSLSEQIRGTSSVRSQPVSEAKTHRKFSSFMATSRVGRPGYHHRVRYRDHSSDSLKEAKYQPHSDRSSTWNGTEISNLYQHASSDHIQQTRSSDIFNDETRVQEPIKSVVGNPPRSAISMGNLQEPPPNDSEVNSRGWNNRFSPKTKEQAQLTNMKPKAMSQTLLSPSSENDPTYITRNHYGQINNLNRSDNSSKASTSPAVSSPREILPSPPAIVAARPFTEKYPQNSLDNPNYEHFPSPPPDFIDDLVNKDPTQRQFSLSKNRTPPLEPTRKISSRHSDESPVNRKSTSPPKVTSTSLNSNKGSQTLDRPSSAKKTEVARVAPTQKKKQSYQSPNKSSTLPRHFKSTSPWEREEREKREQSIQEQLNALRDEEINELRSKDNLAPFEQERLNNLLQEREFQARVQEEKMKLFSDDDLSEEDYSVPDRPDRDRLIRLEGAHALRDAAARVTTNDQDDKDHQLWKQEQQRKKEEAEIRAKQEAERKEERRRERERAERERQEEKRKRELQREEEQNRYEEEQRNLREKEMKWRDNYNSLQREEEEQRRRLEEIRRMREEEENQLRELQVKRQAEERAESVHRRQEVARVKKREADAREEAEREYLEEKLSAGKSSGLSPSYKNYYPVSPRSTGNPSTTFTQGPKSFYKSPISPVSTSSNVSKSSTAYEGTITRPLLRENTKTSSARPVSDGYALGKTNWSHENTPPTSSYASTTPPASYNSNRPVSYVSTSNKPKVIGAQEIYNDPRSRREASLKRDQSIKRRGPDPSRLTFKDRQRFFQGGTSSPLSKPKTSRKLMELEESLRGQM